jgi:LmbE family N-acetylglucosaminyl deacetylase
MNSKNSKSIAVIVAHPDDETLWAGGTILKHRFNKWFVVCLCRASDKERSERFYNTLKLLNAEGIMGDLDDGPDQHPLKVGQMEKEILRLLPTTHFDLILTHNCTGEYTRHLRHEEVNKAVLRLWNKKDISCNELWTFAYEDGDKAYFPQAVETANIVEVLSQQIWAKKYKIMTETYGFDKDSWEAETTPTTEAFWKFNSAYEATHSTDYSDDEIEMSKLSILKLSGIPK